MPQPSHPSQPLKAVPQTSLTFDELRLASMLHKPTAVVAMDELMALAGLLSTGALEDFADGKDIEASTRLIRQGGKREQIARTLAGIVIQIDKFAALNKIDLAQAIRDRFTTGER